MVKMMDYNLVRSKRKTLALYVRQDGSLEVRAPLKTSKGYIEDFIKQKQDWITATRSKLSDRQETKKTVQISAADAARYKKQAKEYLQLKCRYYSELMGLRPSAVRINSAKTRWGSCNGKGEINFTFRLIFAPEELIDYVVVHELAHLKEMNHSSSFWAVVEQTMPDYRERRKRLREHQHQFEFIVT
ncbi:M48 family metallopeptidase [Anoxybacterium hadale]|uniref:M48 family metallopeptidase n=1 Tax=Anoxybacterium hadale TaxID=3408580 RepID=UPI003B0041A0